MADDQDDKRPHRLHDAVIDHFLARVGAEDFSPPEMTNLLRFLKDNKISVDSKVSKKLDKLVKSSSGKVLPFPVANEG